MGNDVSKEIVGFKGIGKKLQRLSSRESGRVAPMGQIADTIDPVKYAQIKAVLDEM